jgi:hypothetical protein
MKGKILDYNITQSQGIISAADGSRVNFTTKEWRSDNIHPTVGQEVDFELTDEKEAKNIYALDTPQSDTIKVEYKRTSTAAIVSFIFGLIGLFFDWWIFAIPSIIAIIAGHMAKSDIKNSNGMLEGSGFATIGLILGYLVLFLYLFVVVVFAGALLSMGNY